MMIKSIYRFLSPKFQNLALDYKVDFKPRYGHGKAPHPELYNIINAHREQYSELIDNILTHTDLFHQIKKSDQESDPKSPAWNNGFLPGLDMVLIYTMLAKYKPKQYLEVGSGNSTKMAYAAKQNHKLKTHITSIDPQPRAEIDALADTVMRIPFENSQVDVAQKLEANDILFIDNSHRVLPNSDAMVFFMEILPRLKSGVIVHIHDIYLPYDYPQFMCDRAYSEQYALAFYLLANPEKYRCIFPNYFVSEDKELAQKLEPIWQHHNLEGVEKHGGSFWLQIV